MHILEELQLNGGGGGTRLGDGSFQKENGVSSNTHGLNGATTKKHTERPNEVIISLPEGVNPTVALESLVASWILLVRRYQRDAFHNFSWGLESSPQHEIQTIGVEQLELATVSTAADLLRITRKLLSHSAQSDITTNPAVVFNDGTKDEWAFRATAQFETNQIRATSQWQPPTMAKHQAVSQLHTLSFILNTILSQPDVSVSKFVDVAEDDLEEIWAWNHPLPPAIDVCMHDLISEKASEHPEKIAIEAWDGSLTYVQVDQFSTELAQNLLLLDDKQPIVPLLFEKSRWTIVSVLAVMKAGKCFALLDPAQPEGRLRTIVQQTKATLMVSSKAQSPLASRVASNATIIPISESKFSKLYSPFAVQQPTTSLPAVASSAPLYIQFTSGSTGKPKGCIISHSQYTSGAIPRAYDVGYRSDSRVLDFASYAFDVCIDSMLCTLAHGGTLCTPSDERRMNDLSGAMRDMKVTLAGMTPSVARTLDVDILDQLGSIALGGEGVSASDAASWGKRTKIVNAYGPSECTVGATINADVGAKPYITMGKGKGCAIWVVDPTDHNKLVPIGAVGELLIEGPIVGIGYLDNEEKTKEVFIDSPAFLTAGSAKIPGRRGRMYKTGDLVRYDPDGNGEVIFVGRQDQQVKLRGQRVELSEIEYNMQKHLPSDTLLAAEVIKPGGAGDYVLVAFLVEQRQAGMRHLDGNTFASFSTKFQKALKAMTQQLFEDLPAYMVPSAYIPIWKMPLLVSCKTDRKRLREIGTIVTRQDLRRFNAALSEKIEPTTEMELALRSLWGTVLGGSSDFGANDNFFSMGGDSLRAMRLVAAARKQNILLSVPDIMLHPTLSAMASKAGSFSEAMKEDVAAFSLLPADWSAEEAKEVVAPLCGISSEDVEDIYPCTPLQEGLMALSAKFADAYVAQRIVELPVDVARKLGDAFYKTITDSPILRTRIVNVSGRGLVQVVVRNGHSVHEGTDVQQYLQQDRQSPMELGTALFRYAVISSPDNTEKGYVATTMHHAVYDGWSMPLVVERVNRAYAGKETQRPAQFKHFIRHLSGLDRSASEAYWKERLHGTSPHQFPPLPSEGYTMRADSLLERYVSVPTSAHSQTTLATIIRGAWALVSGLYMGHSDIVFGETLTGRSAAVTGIEQIEGPMITTIPVRVRMNMDRTVAQYLHDVHASTVQQIPHEHLGLQNIRRVSRDARHACELKTGLVLHPKEDENWGDAPSIEDAPANGFVPSDDAEAAREALKFNTYGLMLVCTLDADGFLIMASYDSNCISPPVMERVLAVLDRVVIKFCGNPEHLLGDVAVLDSEEKKDAEKIRPKLSPGSEPAMSLKQQSNTENRKSGSAETITEKEKQLCNILAPILGLSANEIKPSDSFFELGGDSIGAMRLVSEARSRGLEINVAQIFQSRSLSALAASVHSTKETKIREILGRVLGISTQDISVEDSFFELGGDSIGAMRLVSEARSLGLGLTVAQIFQSKSISSLASTAEEINSSGVGLDNPDAAFASPGVDAASSDRIRAILENQSWEIQNIYPARPLQKLAVEGTVDSPRYSIRYELIQFPTPIDEAQLLSSCQQLVASNEILRTVFVLDNDETLAVVLKNFRTPFEHVAVPEGVNIREFAKNASNADIEAPKPYGSSFVSFTLFTSVGGSESILAFRISHAQYDEMCLPVLYQQLAALYSGTKVPSTIPFTRHVNHVLNTNITQSIPYWRKLLQDSRMSILTPATPLKIRTVIDFYSEFDISSRPGRFTIGSLPTAAWAVVLARRLQTRDVVFGEVVSGRSIGTQDADRIFGPTWNYVPFRVPFEARWTYNDLLEFVQQQHVQSAAYEGMGLSEIVENCTTWDPKEVTWFDTVVHQAPEFVESMDFGGLKAVFETLYPHQEPLREWKCQAFVKDGGKKLGIEIVTFEEWGETAKAILNEVGEVLGKLTSCATQEIFPGSEDAVNGANGEPECSPKPSLEHFEGVM